MLIDNKFIYLNLPRCASTSFHIACLKYELDIQYYDDIIHNLNPKKIKKDLDNEYIADNLTHSHERLSNLKKKFGNNLPVLAIKRDPYERYISLWKHIIDELYRIGEMEMFEIFKSLSTDDVLSYTSNDIYSNDVKYPAIKEFFKRCNANRTDPYVTAMIYMLMSPTSHYHQHDKSIIWFDFKELDKLENWVSNKIGFDFKLEKTNSSQHFECSLKNDDYFKKKYDSIYGNYDNPKVEKSLI
jgi:hypothetical protein